MYPEIRVLRPGRKATSTSGCAENEEFRTALAMGAGGFLTKPYLRPTGNIGTICFACPAGRLSEPDTLNLFLKQYTVWIIRF